MDECGGDPNPAQPAKDEQLDPTISACLANYAAVLAGHSDALPFDRGAESNPEKKRIASRLSGFAPRQTPIWREITRRFGDNIKQPELVSIAAVLAHNSHIKLDRDAKRRKCCLIKWFEENWAGIAPYLDCVVLESPNPE
jgi:hypothetical protein